MWLGHADLSVSLGVAGDLESEVYREAERRILDSCRSHGMPFTVATAPTPAIALEQAALGCFTVFVDDELGLLERALSGYVEEFRAGLAARQAN